MLSGALAGGVAAAITTPLDVCKTLLNTQQNVKPTGMIHAVKTIYRLRGFAGYFRGRVDITELFFFTYLLFLSRYAS